MSGVTTGSLHFQGFPPQRRALPTAWRGAALSDRSSVGKQQAAPGKDPRFAMVADVRVHVLEKRFVPKALGKAHTLGNSREPPVAYLQNCNRKKAAPLQGCKVVRQR
jgi:hypothetical protein